MTNSEYVAFIDNKNRGEYMKEKYIKSPLNYVGGKYKLLNELVALFPTELNTFVDLFWGGVQCRDKRWLNTDYI